MGESKKINLIIPLFLSIYAIISLYQFLEGKYAFILAFVGVIIMLLFFYYFSAEKLKALLLILYGVQNANASKYQAIDFGFMRLDYFDLAIVMLIIIILIKMNPYKSNKGKILLWSFSIFVLYYWIIGLINKNQLFNVLMDTRSIFYFFAAFNIFIFTSKQKSEKYVVVAGFIQSLAFIYTILKNSDIANAIFFRDASYNLFLSYLSFCIALIRNIKYKNIVIFVNTLAILISQTRTVIIPLIVFSLVFGIYNLKKLNIRKLLTVPLIIFVIFFFLKSTQFYEILINRFSPENVTGEGNTLSLRIDSVFLNKDLIDFLVFITGKGMGTTFKYYPMYGVISEANELEMFLPNIFYKYGIVLVIYVIYILIMPIKKLLKKDNISNKLFILSFYCMLIGGMISGLSGYQGFFYLGIYLGLIFNYNNSAEVKVYDNCNKLCRSQLYKTAKI